MVVIVGVHCSCPLCAGELIEIPSDGEDTALEVPSAAKGGQAKETKQNSVERLPKRMRLVKKTRIAAALPAPASSSSSTHAAAIARRKGGKRGGSAYIMKDNKYVVGCGAEHIEQLKVVARMLRSGAIATQKDAKAELRQLCARV